jgi:TctA family transporter
MEYTPDNAYALMKWSSAVALVIQIAFLALQATMLRRHGHGAFLWLSLSSVVGILYIAVSLAPYLLPVPEWALMPLLLFNTGLFLIGSLMALHGTRLLFRAYDRLVERTKADGTDA